VTMWTAESGELIGAISPALNETNWQQRQNVAWYVDRCVMMGYADTPALMLACARRYLSGKRKVSPPGHRAAKAKAKEVRNLLASPPNDLLHAIEAQSGTKAVDAYISGDVKAINQIVGAVLKIAKYNPEAVKQLIANRYNP